MVLGMIAFMRRYFHQRFFQRTLREKNRLLAQAPAYARTAADHAAHHCPLIVTRWLQHSGALEHDLAQTVHLYQSGMLRATPNGKWLPFHAEQWYTVPNPGFLWTATVQAAPGIPLLARDLYFESRGDLQIKLDGIFPMAHSQGFPVDQGSLIRFLAEIVWFPSAALSNYIEWEQIDTVTARAAMSYGRITDGVIFHFDAFGDVERLEAERYYSHGSLATLEKWTMRVIPGSYKTFSGIRVPTELEVTWGLPEGDFTWLKLCISDVEYNIELDGLRLRRQVAVAY
ncbi:hypothetical protein DCM91_17500 [Chitinophaga costaii]|nr:hypothetical protein DCM91_17500 [Chitinophaga costaii]